MTLSLRKRSAIILTLIGMSLGFVRSVDAQTIEISPISVEMLPNQMTTTLFVTNRGSDPSTLQVRPYLWGQQGSADQLTATDDLMASPPITNIAPGATQIFRLVLRVAPQHREATYRLLLDQLPPPATAGLIKIALRFSIPVFAEPGTIIRPQLGWQINTGPDGATLVGTNRGGEHVRIINPVLTSANGRRLALESGSTPYILPGAAHLWPIKTGAKLSSGSVLHLTATSDAGPVYASVHVFGP